MVVSGTLSRKIHRLEYLLILVALAAILSGCSGNDEKEKDKSTAEGEQGPAVEVIYEPRLLSVLPAEAALLLQNEKGAMVIDVRTPQEQQGVRIPGSVVVPLGVIMEGSENLPKDKPLLLVCDVGGRSYAAGLYLLKNGYARLYNLRGGIAAWQRAGMVIEAGSH